MASVAGGAEVNSQFAEPSAFFSRTTLGCEIVTAGRTQRNLVRSCRSLPEHQIPDFGHLRAFAPGRILKLILARTHCGDPTEIEFSIPVDAQLPAMALTGSYRNVFLRLVLIEGRDKNSRRNRGHDEDGFHRN